MNISVELAEISSYGGFFALIVGGDASGWHPVGQSYADGCLDLIDAGARLRLPEPIGEPVDRDSPCEELLYRVVVHHQMEPLEAGLRVKLAPALLSGNIASALVGAS